MGDLTCDIAEVFEKGDFSVLPVLASVCRHFEAELSSQLTCAIQCENKTAEKILQGQKTIAELKAEIETSKSEIDKANLQQPVLDKKIANAIKYEQELKEMVQIAKDDRNHLTLEMVDLEEEWNKRKKHKLLTWDAIKRACHTYNQYLDFHIQLEDIDGNEHVRVSFFAKNDTKEEKYYTCMSHQNECWKVEEIHPALTKEQLDNLKDTIDISKNYRVHNATAFLCSLRNIFLQYHIGKN